MSPLDSWLQPLKAYPRGLVLVCFAISAAAVLWGLAKVAKWSAYLLALAVFAGLTAALALWLWE
ncbi:MAG: hypothetical protein JF599_03880 [Verrucomicrobia bacterium]|nr:hypothetical protein [Verrucomicrobiota bacterium]